MIKTSNSLPELKKKPRRTGLFFLRFFEELVFLEQVPLDRVRLAELACMTWRYTSMENGMNLHAYWTT